MYNVGDLVGKAAPCTPALILGGKWRLLVLAVLRVAFIPLLLVIKGLDSGYAMLAVDLLLSLTNGYLTTVIMIRAAEGLAPVDQEVRIECVAHTDHSNPPDCDQRVGACHDHGVGGWQLPQLFVAAVDAAHAVHVTTDHT